MRRLLLLSLASFPYLPSSCDSAFTEIFNYPRMGSSQNLPSNGQEAVLSTDPKCKKRKNRHSTLNFADNVDEDAQLLPDPGSNIRRGRGSTFLPDVIKDRSSGVRKVVKYNKRGQAIGETRAKYSSYLGVLARTMVPIDRTWKKVSDENKEMLWRCVKTTFDVDQYSRKNVLSAIAANCRTFRKVLTRYIRAYKSDLDIISRPPAIYSFIEREHWDAFVKHRLTKDFEKHNDNQRGKQRENKFRHRLGRKGYANFEQEQIKMIKKSIDGAEDEVAEVEDVDDADEIDRSILWKKSRQNKNGEYDNEDIEEQAAMIDEFTKQAQEGNLDLGGSTDILALVLCKHERSRVRGIGDFVTPTAYFQMPRRGGHSHCQEKIKALQTAMSQMKDQFYAMSQQVPRTPQSEYVSSNTIKSYNTGNPQLNSLTMENMVRTRNDMPPDPKSKTKKSQPCKLAVGSLDNIVAHGTMFEKVGPEEPLHTVPLGEANVRVSIDFVIQKDAILPVPIVGELYVVGDATGYHVAWPKNLILFGNEGASKNLAMDGKKATSSNVDSDKYLESFRSFDDYVETVAYKEAFTITLDEDMFGANVEVPLQRVDMEYMSQMKELSVTCIMLYMSQLYRVIKSANLGRKFFFVNPSAISGTTKQGSQSTLLASLLKDAENDQLVFIPYNLGCHWVLFVIDLSYPTVYYLDSLHGATNPNLKLIIKTAVKIRDNAKNMRRTVDWKEVECLEQPSTVECGFFVMRFMKDLVADPSMLCRRDILYCLYIAVAGAVGERKESKGQRSDADSTLIWLSSVNLLRTTARIFQLMFFCFGNCPF
ncbi:uncharacterized protein LOC131316371 isoform X2 [Rhododendron vialii]|uniref:uncharacterized protein LOC131316371 isoform X2 n=1 Tax=Rhododendron vialii TaxID=182163 RepID=UPI00265F89C1|nr:uncharacterized protein LOC131316371 isoform X2 [Rhododendron vialii]